VPPGGVGGVVVAVDVAPEVVGRSLFQDPVELGGFGVPRFEELGGVVDESGEGCEEQDAPEGLVGDQLVEERGPP